MPPTTLQVANSACGEADDRHSSNQCGAIYKPLSAPLLDKEQPYMASEAIDSQPITVAADDVQPAQRTAAALQRLVAEDGPLDAAITTADGDSVEIAPYLVAAFQQPASLLAQGDDVALVPVHKELSLTEAATLLCVSVPFLTRVLDAQEIPSSGTGDDRRVRLSDLIAYKARRSDANRRDLATALAEAQEAGAYD